MKLASPDSRKQTGAAISSGSATRFCRLPWPNAIDPCSTLPARVIISGSVMPVLVRPGATVLTRISGATSRASWREKARIAPLAAPYGALPDWALTAATDATFTIAPPGRLRITGSTCRQNRNVPPTCTVIMRCQRSNDHSSIGPNSAWPAALNRQSTDPKCCATVSTQRPTESSSATSAPSAIAPSSSPATACARSSSRSATATRPPSAANRLAGLLLWGEFLACYYIKYDRGQLGQERHGLPARDNPARPGQASRLRG